MSVAEDVALASSFDADPDQLVRLAASRRVAVRAEVAANPAAPAEAFEILADDRNERVRLVVSTNPATAAQHATLSLGRRWGLITLAWQRHLDEDVAHALCDVEDPEVREQLAGATHWGSVLARLFEDPDPSVRGRLAWNDAVTDPDRERLAADPSWEVRAAVARDQRTAVALVERLLEDPDTKVKRAALSRLPLTPEEFAGLERARDLVAARRGTWEDSEPFSHVWFHSYKFPREVEILQEVDQLAWRLLREDARWSAWYEQHRDRCREAPSIIYFEDRTDLSIRALPKRAGVHVGVPVRDMRAAEDMVGYLRDVLAASMKRLAEVLELPPPPEVDPVNVPDR